MKILKALSFVGLLAASLTANALVIQPTCIESLTCNIDSYAAITNNPTVTKTFTTSLGNTVNYKISTIQTSNQQVFYRVFILPQTFTDPRDGVAKTGFREIIIVKSVGNYINPTTGLAYPRAFVEDHQRKGSYLFSWAFDSSASNLHEWATFVYVENADQFASICSAGVGGYICSPTDLVANYNKPYMAGVGGAYVDNWDNTVAYGGDYSQTCVGNNKYTGQCMHLRVLEKTRLHNEVIPGSTIQIWSLYSVYKDGKSAPTFSFGSFDLNAMFAAQFFTPSDGTVSPSDRDAVIRVYN